MGWNARFLSHSRKMSVHHLTVIHHLNLEHSQIAPKVLVYARNIVPSALLSRGRAIRCPQRPCKKQTGAMLKCFYLKNIFTFIQNSPVINRLEPISKKVTLQIVDTTRHGAWCLRLVFQSYVWAPSCTGRPSLINFFRSNHFVCACVNAPFFFVSIQKNFK